MAKDTYYFQHDYNSRNDDKVLELRAECGAAGYGIYWMLIESLAETETGYLNRERIGGLSLGFGVPKAELIRLLDFCIKIGLLCEKDGEFYSQRMLKHKAFRQVLKESGQKGAKKRWDNGGANGEAMATPMQRKGKESKEKESKKNLVKIPKVGEQHLETLSKEHNLDLNYLRTQLAVADEYYQEKNTEITYAKFDAWLTRDPQSRKNPQNPNKVEPPYYKRFS